MSSSQVIKNRLDQRLSSEIGVDSPALKEGVDTDDLSTSFCLMLLLFLFLFFSVYRVYI